MNVVPHRGAVLSINSSRVALYALQRYGIISIWAMNTPTSTMLMFLLCGWLSELDIFAAERMHVETRGVHFFGGWNAPGSKAHEF